MAISVNVNALPESSEGGNKETKFIPAGNQLARLVSYVEMGFHTPEFNGKVAMYDSGKRAGEVKDDEFIIQLVFEFPACEYTGDFPLTIATSIPWKDGFLNKLSIGKALLEGRLSKQYALRSKYIKYLNAFKDATSIDSPSLDAFIDKPLMITVKNVKGKVKEDGTAPVYANMTPEGITSPSMRHPMTGKLEEYEVPAIKGEYCVVYDWESPTKEAWDSLRTNVQDCIKRAKNYIGSPTEAMLLEFPDQSEGTVQDKATEGVPEVSMPKVEQV